MGGSGCLVGDGGRWVEILFESDPCWVVVVEELVVGVEIADGGVIFWFFLVWPHRWSIIKAVELLLNSVMQSVLTEVILDQSINL